MKHYLTTSPEDKKPLTLFEVAGSVLAAAFGVQSEANKKRDFTRGKPMQFLVVGIVFTALFLLSVIGLVQLIL